MMPPPVYKTLGHCGDIRTLITAEDGQVKVVAEPYFFVVCRVIHSVDGQGDAHILEVRLDYFQSFIVAAEGVDAGFKTDAVSVFGKTCFVEHLICFFNCIGVEGFRSFLDRNDEGSTFLDFIVGSFNRFFLCLFFLLLFGLFFFLIRVPFFSMYPKKRQPELPEKEW